MIGEEELVRVGKLHKDILDSPIGSDYRNMIIDSILEIGVDDKKNVENYLRHLNTLFLNDNLNGHNDYKELSLEWISVTENLIETINLL